jgi:hypothetical protein
VRWKNKGQIKERLLLSPLNELLLCAAFTEDGIPERPTHQPPRRIRVTKRRDSSPKNKRPPRGPQPPVAISTFPKGPSLQAAQITITPSRPHPEQRQGAYYPQEAMEPAQGYLNPCIYWDQSQQLRHSQAENLLSAHILCDDSKNGRGGLFSYQTTNAFAMGMPAQPMSPQQLQSQRRAQQYRRILRRVVVLRRHGQYNVWLGHTRPYRCGDAGHPGDNVPIVLACVRLRILSN